MKSDHNSIGYLKKFGIYQNSSEATEVNYAEIAEFVYNQIIVCVYIYIAQRFMMKEKETLNLNKLI